MGVLESDRVKLKRILDMEPFSALFKRLCDELNSSGYESTTHIKDYGRPSKRTGQSCKSSFISTTVVINADHFQLENISFIFYDDSKQICCKNERSYISTATLPVPSNTDSRSASLSSSMTQSTSRALLQHDGM